MDMQALQAENERLKEQLNIMQVKHELLLAIQELRTLLQRLTINQAESITNPPYTRAIK